LEAAPLISLPGVAAPAGGGADWFTAADGARLRVALFAPEGQARGSVVISPGRTEPIEKYLELTGELLARGFVVLVHDWRGQGLSQRALPDRLAGHAAGFEGFVDDYRCILAAYEARLPKPWLTVGHSMGGCLTLAALVDGEDRFEAALLCAPMLGIQIKEPLWLARGVSALMTRIGRGAELTGQNGDVLYERFDGNLLTHDRARWDRVAALLKACPNLALGAPTWSWLRAALSAMRRLRRPEALAAVTIPVTILSAGDDLIVDNAAQAWAAARLAKGRLVTVPGAKHEILQETDDLRAAFWREFEALT
jgi:alpha-beta hydrolase superfamily lysophospholipase